MNKTGGMKDAATALLKIDYMMEKMAGVLWRRDAALGGGRGPWHACLAALVLVYDPACKPRRLLEALPAEREMDKIGFLNAMANLGYFSRGMTVALGDIERRLLPCLFLRGGDESAPCIILRRDEEGITFYDSARHRIETVAPGAAAERETGEAHIFLPYDEQLQASSKFMREGSGWGWFWALSSRFSETFKRILVTCFALNIFALAPSLFVMFVYDRVISPVDLSALPMMALGVALALVAEVALRAARSEGLSWMTARLDNLIGGRIFSHLVGLPPELIERASVAAQVARVKTFESVRDFFSSAVFLSFVEVPFVLVAAAVMGAIAGPLVLVPLGMIGAYVLLFFAVRGKVRRVLRLAAKASSARQQFALETFEKLRGVRACGLTEAWKRKFDDLSGRETLLNFELGFLGTVAETLANGLTILAAVFTVGAGAHLIWTGEMTTGALVASMILVWRILLPFYSLCTMIPRIEQLRSSVQQVDSLMELETETDKPATALPGLRGEIALENADLSYGEEVVIRGCSLRLERGTLAAVTGANGAGKSSLLKMIKGLHKPQGGAVRIDGFDIRQLDPIELRRQIAYVPQKPDFFPGTVLENLLIANPLATRDEVEAALRRAAVGEGLDLRAPLHKEMLSAELAARLSLVRAYLQNAPVVLVDELPHAVMNGPAGRNLMEYLRDGRTAVIVSYRGDVLSAADVVVRLTPGETPRSDKKAGKAEREAA